MWNGSEYISQVCKIAGFKDHKKFTYLFTYLVFYTIHKSLLGLGKVLDGKVKWLNLGLCDRLIIAFLIVNLQ